MDALASRKKYFPNKILLMVSQNAYSSLFIYFSQGVLIVCFFFLCRESITQDRGLCGTDKIEIVGSWDY